MSSSCVLWLFVSIDFLSVNEASTGKLTLILMPEEKLWMLNLELCFNLWQIEFLDLIQILMKCMK